jgi:spore coat polysaccharide biosynthesis protein SpsF
MKIAAIIAADTMPHWLPGKAMIPVDDKPLLEIQLERLKLTKSLEMLVVATSVDAGDDSVAHLAEKLGVECFRGSRKNIADRYRAAAARYELDAFVCLNAASPLIDPVLIDLGVRLFLKHIPDLVTNVQESSFPRGQAVEVVSVPAFHRALGQMNQPAHFEEVTRYFYEHPGDFRIHNFPADGNFSQVRMSVESDADLLALEEVVHRMDKPHVEYGWKDLLQLYKEATSWLRTLQG